MLLQKHRGKDDGLMTMTTTTTRWWHYWERRRFAMPAARGAIPARGRSCEGAALLVHAAVVDVDDDDDHDDVAVVWSSSWAVQLACSNNNAAGDRDEEAVLVSYERSPNTAISAISSFNFPFSAIFPLPRNGA